MIPTVSVIVPVYGVAAYLPACLDSLAAQTLPEMEFIVVDDGSPDESGAICDAYAGEDPRFRVYHMENAGVGQARNMGLKHARGRYIGFTDGDDVLETDFYAELYAAAEEEEADMVACNYSYLKGTEITRRRCPAAPSRAVYQGEEAVRAVYSGVISPEIWNKLYRRGLLESLHFESYIVHEDALFNMQALLRSRCVAYRDIAGYLYRVRDTSVTRRRVTTRYIDDYIEVKERLVALTGEHCPACIPLAKKNLMDALIRSICQVLDDGAAELRPSLTRMRARLKSLRRDTAFVRALSAADRHKLFAMNGWPRLYAWLRRRRGA